MEIGGKAVLQNSLYTAIKQLPINPETTIHTTYQIKHLPNSYLTFLKTYGAGYLKKTKINTLEPTRDGLDYVLLYGLFGWQTPPSLPPIQPNSYEQNTNTFKYQKIVPSILDNSLQPHYTGLPEYFVVFYYENQRYFAFDYSSCKKNNTNTNTIITPCEPKIRYIDQETDQWLIIAENFNDLLGKLHQTKIFIGDDDYYHHASKEAIRQQLGALTSHNDAQKLFDVLTENIDDLELIEWLAWWIKKDHTTISPVASDSLEFQLDFRKYALQNSAIKAVIKDLHATTALPSSLEELIQEYLSE